MEFSNELFFGSMNRIIRNSSTIRCTVINMLLNDTLSYDGLINTEKHKYVLKRDILAYLFYLWKENRHIHVFQQDPTPLAFKKLLAQKSYYINKEVLITKVNKIVQENYNIININILKTLIETIERKLINDEFEIEKALEHIRERVIVQ